MKTYEEYKRLAIKELTGYFPEELDEQRKVKEKEYKEGGWVWIDPFQWTNYELQLAINGLIMIDLGKLLNNK